MINWIIINGFRKCDDERKMSDSTHILALHEFQKFLKEQTEKWIQQKFCFKTFL